MALWAIASVGVARLIRRGHLTSIIVSLLALAFLEVSLFSSQNNVPSGVFNPSLGGFSLSLFEIAISTMVAGYLLSGRGIPLTPALCWWAGFVAWLAVGTGIGFAYGNVPAEIMFTGRAIIYLGVLFVVASVPARELVDRRGLPLLLLPAAIVAALLEGMAVAGSSVALPIPGLAVAEWGAIGGDAATLFTFLGTLAAGLAFVSEARRMLLLAIAAPLLAAPLFSFQRASLIGLVAALAVLALAFSVGPGRQRIRVRGSEVLVVVLAVCSFAIAGVIAKTAATSVPPPVPVVRAVDDAFTRQGKESAALSRVNQWKAATALARERPVFGHGVGVSYAFYDPGAFTIRTSNVTHNAPLDVLVRTGAAGLALFVVALALTYREGVRAWLRQRDADVAALALACLTGLTILLAKGMVESFFEKYRLMVLFAIVLGALFSTILATRVAETAPLPNRIRRSGHSALTPPTSGRRGHGPRLGDAWGEPARRAPSSSVSATPTVWHSGEVDH